MTAAPGASRRLSDRARPLVLYAALLAGLFLAGAAFGYVYKHDPQPEVVSVRVEAPPASNAARVVSGTVSSIEAGKLTIATDSGPVTLALPATPAVDQLVRAASGLPAGTPVNVGVEATQYGLTLTGIVAIEGAR